MKDESVRDRISVLFGARPQWRAGIEAALRGSRFDFSMQDLATLDPREADLVVPMTFADQDVLRGFAPGAVNALVQTLAPRDLCRDKLSLNLWLEKKGYGWLVPKLHLAPPQDPALYPLMLKRRRGEWGQGIVRLDAPPERAEFDPGTMFLQEMVETSVEWAAHLTFQDGALIHGIAVRHEMAGPGLVKGQFNKPLRSRMHRLVPHQALWLELAQAMGLREGTICIDFAEVAGRPVLYEINPRFGATLVLDLPGYLEICLAALSGACPPRIGATDGIVGQTVSSTLIA